MKLSIIIPVYNVEKYLLRCLDSCANQNIPSADYEIIIVNDGSPDGSKVIAEEFVAKHPNARLINQENGGLSVARNNGLKEACGKYVWFVDSDDWIESNCLNEIVEKMDSGNLDMLQIGYLEAYDDGRTIPSNRGFFEGCNAGREVMKSIYVPAPAQFTIYRRNFLTKYDLTFFPKIYHEDAEFKPRALFYSQKFASLNKHVYYYYQRSAGSIMSSYSLKRGMDVLTVCDSLCVFKDNVSMSDDIRKEFDYIITTYLNEFFRGIVKLNNDEKATLIKQFRKKSHLISSIGNSKLKAHRLEALLLAINVPLGIRIINRLR